MAGSSKLISSSIPLVKDLVDSTRAGLAAGKEPKRIRGSARGAGGSYYLYDVSGNCVAVFKPLEEEANAMNNPGERMVEESLGRAVAVAPEGLKKGTKAGKGGYREAAAFVLDHPISGRRAVSGEAKGFAGVPPTTVGSFSHRTGSVTAKLGSLQKYIDKTGTCASISSAVYNEFPDDEVHKIAVLDMRLANADRHGGNILRSKSSPVVLTPIDHGYCFPDSFEEMTFEWLAWPQAKKPFSGETIKYIETLDAEEDIHLLESYGWRMPPPAIARVFRISTMLLKKGAKRGLTPYAIGEIMCRKIPNILEKDISVIEEIVKQVQEESSEKDDEKFLEAVSNVMDRRLDEIGTPS